MIIELKGNKRIVIDESYFKNNLSKFEMKNNTSYLDKFVQKYNTSNNYKKRLLPLKLTCLYNLRNKVGDYDSYLDLLAGLGISSRIFECKNGETYLNELDESCLEILRENYPIEKIYSKDMFNFNFDRRYDFIFVDFNNFTFKRYLEVYKAVLKNCFNNCDKYLILNDCSVFYLRYGATSFDTYNKYLGCKVDNYEDFYKEMKKVFYKEFNWNLTDIEYFRDSSFLLFKKEDKELTINYNAEPASGIISYRHDNFFDRFSNKGE